MEPQIDLDMGQIEAFCDKWGIAQFSLFGSVLRDDFGPDSDVDVLVKGSEQARWSLFDLVDMKQELEAIFGRKVDLIEPDGIRNPFRRYEIATSRKVIYAA